MMRLFTVLMQCPSSVSFRAGPKHCFWRRGLSGWARTEHPSAPQQGFLTIETQVTTCLATVSEINQSKFKLFQHCNTYMSPDQKKPLVDLNITWMSGFWIHSCGQWMLEWSYFNKPSLVNLFKCSNPSAQTTLPLQNKSGYCHGS